ncbi:response regulator [Marinimicrobium sp. ABcell2]|uniref:response regulator n=1 Tax=Marinimicrobium sp. ABcell2 TaxID=3069751 RepID=UPI0027AF391F|nr:response regulator [Marinimicrobium sp. ABcell2]MDQ2075390.1 response regulator [Marinimicrobium sp. ABcell2]
MIKNSLKHDVGRLILLPALAITLILAGSLTYLYLSQLNKFVTMRGGALSEKLAHMSHVSLIHGNAEMLPTLLEASLEEPYVRAVQVHLAESGIVYRSGASMLPPLEGADADMSQRQMRRTPKSIRFAHPVVDVNHERPLGWLELELLTSPFLVLRYKTFLIALILTLLGAGLATILSLRLHRKIITPLADIKGVLSDMAEGQLGRRIEPQQCREFQDLADTVNTMGASLEEAHKDMQIHIDQSMEDLRETLETIEVQNIELNMARKEALEASRIKSEFLANTSHEIRTPLNGILGFTNLALKTQLDDQQRGYLQTIRDSSQNLLTVINDILDFSKIEAGKLTLDYVPLPLRRVVEEAVHIQAPDAHEKNLQLITLVDDKIPLRLLGDPLRLKQVLANLVSNAIKFSQKGNIVIHAALLSRQENQITIKISVTDSGIGLTEEQKARLFRAFDQADSSSSREHGGTGLGLVICRGLVERMGGEIGVESEASQGARFWFTARLGIDKTQPDTEERPLLGKRVLVCSENAAFAQQAEHLLRLWQADTDSVQSIHDIFTKLRSASENCTGFSLVLLDIAPEERRIRPQLLHNLAQQLTDELGCALVIACTPAHQEILRGQNDTSLFTFVHKPVTHDSLLEALAPRMNIDLKANRSQTSNDEHSGTETSAKILVVDDNPANLQLASELLRGLNTHVVQASSGQAALEVCANEDFDLIFMDIQMPGMDGIETTRELRLRSTGAQRTPIIALTAHSMTEQKSELLIAGLDDCISKPVSEAQLAHIINRWVNLNGRKVRELVAKPSNTSTPDTEPRSIPSASEPGPVDIALCLKLANHKAGLARDMLVMMLQNLDAERNDINRAYDNKDFEQMEELVHRLYGSCCYCGVPRLKRISGLVDKILQNRQYDQLSAPVTALHNEIEEILRWGYQRDIDSLFDLSE